MPDAMKHAPGTPVENAVVLVTGAAGGIGSMLVAALRDAGAAEVVAAARRDAPAMPGVTPLQLDITNEADVARAAAEWAPRIDILINNAGFNANRRLLSEDSLCAARQEMEANYFGLLNMAQAFAPAMRERRRGTIVNLLTFLAHVNHPSMASYCASKAAAHSITQALRAELAPAGVHVCAVFPTAVDTAMSRDLPGPKLSPAQLAADVIKAIRSGAEDVYPGMAEQALRQFRLDPKQMERQMAQRLA